ncbi:hypothetical protein SDC9_172589 [bioreactor metagenome]|uniref:Uncharacterized protein n=1 Tax=bioreactor metagenome TaxID=1076179 RepID=A0A645GGJ8_9ZZZZ
MIWSEALVFISMACMTFYTVLEFLEHLNSFVHTLKDMLAQTEEEVF